MVTSLYKPAIIKIEMLRKKQNKKFFMIKVLTLKNVLSTKESHNERE